MNEFISKNQSLSLGLIMHNIDLDSAITGKIKEGMQKGLFELDVHGWDHVDYTQLSKEEQLGTLQQANDKMNIIFGHYSQTFIPPYNKFDGDTISVLKSSGIRIISSDTSTDKTNYFIADGVNQSKSNDVLYHLPSVATFKNDNGNGTWIKVPIQTILARSDNTINKYGYAVVLLHPQNFAKLENGVYVDVVDEHEINDLSSLIDSIESQDLKITTFTNAVGLDKTYLPTNAVPEFSGIEITVLIISIVSVIAFTTITKKGLFRHF
jgi:peptidoglycan/xylan/chitin deacetylase (PgdA/CDA1 family)